MDGFGRVVIPERSERKSKSGKVRKKEQMEQLHYGHTVLWWRWTRRIHWKQNRGRGRDGFVRGFRGHERGFERGQILEIGIDLLRF